MARDFSLSVETGFMTHVKTRKLCRLLRNPLAFGHAIALWAWAAEAAPSGDLSAIDVPEIESGAGYTAGDGACYHALVAAGFIDEGPSGARTLHNWMQPGRTGYAIQKLEAERDRWRRAKGFRAPAPLATAPAPAEATEDSRGVPAEFPEESTGIPVPSRFTVHGSEEESVNVPPAPARDLWAAGDWLKRFGRAWADRYKALAYGQTSDGKACGTLADFLAARDPETRLAFQERAPKMFAEFLADESPETVKARHCFAFFVGRFGGLLVDPVRTKADADSRCNLHRQQGTFRALPRGGPVTGCPTCRENAAARGTREATPDEASNALPSYKPGANWTPEQLAEIEAARKATGPPPARVAAGGAT